MSSIATPGHPFPSVLNKTPDLCFILYPLPFFIAINNLHLSYFPWLKFSSWLPIFFSPTISLLILDEFNMPVMNDPSPKIFGSLNSLPPLLSHSIPWSHSGPYLLQELHLYLVFVSIIFISNMLSCIILTLQFTTQYLCFHNSPAP